MFVYSAISWEEILVLPILRACVSTWRYRDRRAATPTFRRSATRPPWLDFVTAFSVVPGRLRLRLCKERGGTHGSPTSPLLCACVQQTLRALREERGLPSARRS